MRWLVGVDDWLANYGTEERKNRTRSYFNEERLRQLFAVYGCNETEFSYVVFFTEQRNFTTAERRYGNRRTTTEWWKPGIKRLLVNL